MRAVPAVDWTRRTDCSEADPFGGVADSVIATELELADPGSESVVCTPPAETVDVVDEFPTLAVALDPAPLPTTNGRS